jgi:hypothetical protein
MAEIAEKIQGEDITIDFELSDAQNNPLDIAALHDYAIVVFQRMEKNEPVPLLVYKKTPGPDENPIIITDAPAGKVQIIVPRAFTKIACKGVYYAKIMVQQNDNGYYENSRSNAGASNIALFNLQASPMGNVL